MRQITAENTEILAIAAATLKAGVLSTAVLLFSNCDGQPNSTREACREQVRTLDIARAKSRVAQLQAMSLRGRLEGDVRAVPIIERDTVANAYEELRLAQEDFDARLRRCDNIATP